MRWKLKMFRAEFRGTDKVRQRSSGTSLMSSDELFSQFRSRSPARQMCRWIVGWLDCGGDAAVAETHGLKKPRDGL